MAREISSVGVVGLGTMGAGIVEVFARNGLNVVAVEIAAAALERGRAHLTGSTGRAVTRGKLSPEDRDALLGRVDFQVGLSALGDVDLVIEAVPELLDLKRQIFAELDKVCKPSAILATNTSSLSVTEISVATTRPRQVIGVHFFNPAPIMKLVEVVRTVVTAPEVVGDVEALCARLGKVDVIIGDRAGFVANALLFGYLNQAVTMYEASHATREDLDAAMKLGCGLPMGPLTLLDLIGLDTSYEILDTMYRRGGRSRRHAPAPLLGQMVTAGMLGRKSGRGFYTYERAGSPVVVADDLTPAPSPAVAAGAAGVPEVGAIGVVGASGAADGVTAALAQAGYHVVEVDLDAEPAARERLSGVDLVVAAGPGPVIEAAMATGRPGDVVGMRFASPAAGANAGAGAGAGAGASRAVAVAEVAHTVHTTSRAIETAVAVARSLGAHPVRCPDRAGFVMDALLFPYLNDAVRMVEARYADADGIDNAMKLGCGYPAGPIETLDAIGLDVALAVQSSLYRESREPALAPAPLLEQLVTAGYLGAKTGRGFRDRQS